MRKVEIFVLHQSWDNGSITEIMFKNNNLKVLNMSFSELNVQRQSILSRFRTRLTAMVTWNELSVQVNEQQAHDITVRQGCHVEQALRKIHFNFLGHFQFLKCSLLQHTMHFLRFNTARSGAELRHDQSRQSHFGEIAAPMILRCLYRFRE